MMYDKVLAFILDQKKGLIKDDQSDSPEYDELDEAEKAIRSLSNSGANFPSMGGKK